MSTTEYIQIIIGIGQIIAVAIIPIIVWVLGIKYQNRKAKKDAQLRVFLTLMADRKSTPITKEWVDALNTIDVVFQENKKVRHAWREYSAGKRTLCGVSLPEGLKENDKFPQPIITPTTKEAIGHDEDISKEDIIKHGLVTKEDYEQLEKYTLALFERGTQIAKERGLILVDTKYEFGKADGVIYLIDEIHTPDSSRYFHLEGYDERQAKGEKQRQLSKEFVREWLMENGFQGQEGQAVPEMTPEIISQISERYIELYENIVGEKFVRNEAENVQERIENNLKNWLTSVR